MTKAINILKSGFPMFKMDVIMDIILGNKKLVGINDMTIEDDDATECCGIPLLSMDQQIENKEKAIKYRETRVRAWEEMKAGEWENISSIHGLIPVPFSMLERNCKNGRYYFNEDDGFDIKLYEEWFPDQVVEAKSKLNSAILERRIEDTMVAIGLNRKLAKDLIKDPISTIDSVNGNAKKDEPPKIDKDLNGLNGWISPEGDFYSCGFMGHIDLADRLGFKEGEIEKTWVKVRDREDPNGFEDIRKSLPHDFMLPNKITQSQFDWCQKHKRNTPEDIESYVKEI